MSVGTASLFGEAREIRSVLGGLITSLQSPECELTTQGLEQGAGGDTTGGQVLSRLPALTPESVLSSARASLLP